MKRPTLLAILTFLLLLIIFAAAADAVQARLRSGPAIQRQSPELPREWVWRRKVIVLDDMYRKQ